MPCSMHQRSSTWAGVRPWRCAIRATVSLSGGGPSRAGYTPRARCRSEALVEQSLAVLVRTEFHLVHNRRDHHRWEQLAQIVDAEVGDPYRPRGPAHALAPSRATPRSARPRASGRGTVDVRRPSRSGFAWPPPPDRAPGKNFVVTKTSSRGTPSRATPGRRSPRSHTPGRCRCAGSRARARSGPYQRIYARRNLPDTKAEERDLVPIREHAATAVCRHRIRRHRTSLSCRRNAPRG